MIGRLFERRRFSREHDWTHEHLSEYLDGELDPTTRRRADDHLELCPQCRRILATLRRTVDQLRSLRARPESSIAPAVIQRLREQ